MKRLQWILLPVLLACVAAPAAADGCASKEQEIKRQLAYAQEHGNSYRVRGLETALAKVQAGCTEEGLRAERQNRIDEKRAKVAERQEELTEARRDGDPRKIAKRERKLAQAREALREAEAD